VDTVTVISADVATAIDLGAGDDTLTLGAVKDNKVSKAVAGGEGTDTLAMTAVTAAALDDAAVTLITGFERLTINDAGTKQELDLANLGFTNYVTTTGGELTLKNLANSGTVVVTTDATALTVAIKDAATGKADVLNAVLSSKGDLAGANTLTAANVETVNITSTDTDKTAHTNKLALTADKATTVTVSGNAGLTLDVSKSTLVTLIDGSASTGGLTVETTKGSAAATTVKGGSGADNLKANVNLDVLEGGAGKDTLTVVDGVNLATLRGGAGQDTYVIGKASNSNGYATIDGSAADLKGDTIKIGAAITGFSSAKIVLGATAVFQDYANEAAKAGTAGSVSWFQWAGDTYLVQDNTTASASFSNTADAIVKIVGTAVNFSFNSDAPGILEII
jgi:S-layer protein